MKKVVYRSPYMSDTTIREVRLRLRENGIPARIIFMSESLGFHIPYDIMIREQDEALFLIMYPNFHLKTLKTVLSDIINRHLSNQLANEIIGVK